MKKPSLFALAALVCLGIVLVAADHGDAPSVVGSTADIADYYAFEGSDSDNTVLVATVQGFGTGDTRSFDENVLIEFNIDNDGDLIEDLVIQAIPIDGTMYFFGPYAPSQTGLNSTIDADTALQGEVEITTGSQAIMSSTNGISYFAGPREDPFFFDFNQFNLVVGGNAPNGFNVPGDDSFDQSNILAVVLEVPNTLLGATFPHPAGTGVEVFNTWIETKRRQ